MDELVSEYDLDEEEQEILQTLFKEVYHCFNADWFLYNLNERGIRHDFRRIWPQPTGYY